MGTFPFQGVLDRARGAQGVTIQSDACCTIMPYFGGSLCTASHQRSRKIKLALRLCLAPEAVPSGAQSAPWARLRSPAG